MPYCYAQKESELYKMQKAQHLLGFFRDGTP